MATAHVLYDNKVLENRITNLVNTNLEVRSLMTIDYSLTTEAGLTKTVHKYTYSGKVEKLAKGAKNSERGKVTFESVDYTVNRYQQTYDYNDMDVMKDPMVVDVASRGASLSCQTRSRTNILRSWRKSATAIPIPKAPAPTTTPLWTH